MSELEKRIKELATKSSGDYQAKAADLSGITHNYMASLAKELGPELNAQAQAMPRDTYDQKREVAQWINSELRRFGLAIKCPKTGHPSFIYANPGNNREVGCFLLEHKTPDGKTHRTCQSTELMKIDLMEAPPRREALKEWRDKTKGKDERGRG